MVEIMGQYGPMMKQKESIFLLSNMFSLKTFYYTLMCVTKRHVPKDLSFPCTTYATYIHMFLCLWFLILIAKVVSIFAKYGDIMVDEKMIQNGTLSPDDGEKPWKKGLITFVAFLVFGSAPILSFIILIPFTHNDTLKFIGACILSALALATLGIAKAKIARQNYIMSVGGTLFNGAIAGFAAYVIGWVLRDVAGLED